MAKIVCVLNGGVADVGDDYAKTLIESGYWAVVEDSPAAEEAPVKKTRAPRRKAPVEEPKTEE